MAGLFAKGTTLWVGTADSPSSFGQIGKVKSISGPNFSVTTIDTTTHDTVGNFREFAAVLCEAGEITFTVNYDPSDATHAPATGLYSYMQALTEKAFQLRFPASDALATRMNFNGFITGHPMQFPVDNVIEATITVKIDGAIEWDTVA
jgi:hypothetical protein